MITSATVQGWGLEVLCAESTELRKHWKEARSLTSNILLWAESDAEESNLKRLREYTAREEPRRIQKRNEMFKNKPEGHFVALQCKKSMC